MNFYLDWVNKRDWWKRGILTFLVPVLGGVVAWGLGRLIAGSNLTVLDAFRLFVSLILGLVILIFLVFGHRSWSAGLYVWIITFVLGYRTFHVTSVLQVHPSEILIWVLYLAIVLEKIFSRRRIQFSLPRIGTLFFVLGLLGILTAFASGRAWDGILQEFKILFVAIPIFGVVRELLSQKKSWHRAITVLAVANLYIASLGLLEYFFPDFTTRLTPYFTPGQTGISWEGFTRASFSFWGNPIVVASLVATVPLIFALWFEMRSILGKILIVLTAILSLLAIYVAGFRSYWLSAAFVVVTYFLSKRTKGGLLGFVLVILILGLLISFGPQDFQLRLNNFIEIAEKIPDSSAGVRILRNEDAFSLILQSPLLGWGWGGSGWVHNDFLQIGANLGLPALILMIGWLLSTAWDLWQISNTKQDDALRNWGHALMVAVIVYPSIAVVGGIIALIQLSLPFWLVLALSKVVIDRSKCIDDGTSNA